MNWIDEMQWRDDTAQTITDYFFQRGARIKKEDYDTVRAKLDEAHTKGAQEALAKVEEWVKAQKKHSMQIPDNNGTLGEALDNGDIGYIVYHYKNTLVDTHNRALDDLLHHLQQLKDNKTL